MSDVHVQNAEPTPTQQRVVGVPWKPGQSGNPAGRPKGSRNRLSEDFLADLKTVWAEEGLDALRRSAREDATGFIRVVAGLLPKSVHIDLDATASAVSFAESFKQALSMIQGEPRQVRVIEHDDADRR